jgi:outer membrane protein TolC
MLKVVSHRFLLEGFPMPDGHGRLQSALRTCEHVLRRLADYRLDPALDQRLRDLGERKERLSKAEHDELMALVAFTQQRTLEKLEAEAALQDLHSALAG